MLYVHRALIATIRNNGTHPSPKTTVEKTEIGRLGTKADMENCSKLVRKDNATRQARVRDARALIYDMHAALGSKQVEALLKPLSEVPTEVSIQFCVYLGCYVVVDMFPIERILKKTLQAGIWLPWYADQQFSSWMGDRGVACIV